jgi:hypothetical protein
LASNNSERSVMDGTLARGDVVYDNERGFSNRGGMGKLI